MTERGCDLKKLCSWSLCDHPRRLVSEAARRGLPGQARPWRQRLRGESEAAKQPSTL